MEIGGEMKKEGRGEEIREEWGHEERGEGKIEERLEGIKGEENKGGSRTILVSGDEGGTLKLWDVPTRRVISEQMAVHDRGIMNVVPLTVTSERILLTQGRDGLLHIWNIPEELPVPMRGTKHFKSPDSIMAKPASAGFAVGKGKAAGTESSFLLQLRSSFALRSFTFCKIACPLFDKLYNRMSGTSADKGNASDMNPKAIKIALPHTNEHIAQVAKDSERKIKTKTPLLVRVILCFFFFPLDVCCGPVLAHSSAACDRPASTLLD